MLLLIGNGWIFEERKGVEIKGVAIPNTVFVEPFLVCRVMSLVKKEAPSGFVLRVVARTSHQDRKGANLTVQRLQNDTRSRLP